MASTRRRCSPGPANTTPSRPIQSPLIVARNLLVAEVTDEDWRLVLRRHVAPLASNLDAHLFHGQIRTAHAVRALSHSDNPDARSELAAGLAAWTVWDGDPKLDVAPSAAIDSSAAILELARRGAAAFVAQPSIFTLHAVTAN